MSEHDAKLYQQFISKVRKQINAIQLILNNVEVQNAKCCIPYVSLCFY